MAATTASPVPWKISCCQPETSTQAGKNSTILYFVKHRYIVDNFEQQKEIAAMRRFLPFLLILWALPALARIQEIPPEGAVLDSTEEFPWYATQETVEPERESRNIENNLQPGPIWTAVTIPGNLFEQPGFSSKKGNHAWLLKQFRAPANSNGEFVLHAGFITDRDRVYLNGHLIGQTGQFGARLPQAYEKQRYYRLPEEYLRRGGINVLLIEVEGYFKEEIGITGSETEIRPAADTYKKYFFQNLAPLFFLAAYITVASYFLFLFFRRRKERSNLFFAVFVILLVIYQFFRTDIKYLILTDSFFSMKKMEYLVLFSVVPAFYFFFRTYFTLQKTKGLLFLDRLVYLPLGALSASFIYVLFTDNVLHWNSINKTVVQLFSWPLIFIALMHILWQRLKAKDKDALALAFGLVVVIISVVVDVLTSRVVWNLPRVSGYTFFLFVIAMATVLANKFVRVHQQVEELNESLEKKVELRTRELQFSLEQVQLLKQQQDGDYFLTSLLIDPLSANRTESNFLSVEFIVESKKKFSFRRWKKEIGGDLCAAHKITLRGRSFVTFMSADAMGKSMQGAGGVLVAGSVFSSIIERTHLSSSVSSLYPEQWLRNAIVEINKIFKSFDGSMLISMVLGLVDEQNGFLYFVNAEHPFSILYRDKKASFVEKETNLRKLGMADENFEIQTLQLMPGDVFVTGSDGRDDILLETPEGKVMNEDMDRILSIAEQSEGSLPEMLSLLHQSGEISDDLSLLRIEFRHSPLHLIPAQTVSIPDNLEQFKEYLLQFNETPEWYSLARELALALFRQKKYRECSELSEDLSSRNPALEDFIYLSAYTAKLSGQYASAILLSERLRLRNRRHAKNLVNLIDSSIADARFERAETLLEEAASLGLENSNIERLKNVLHSKKKIVA